MLLSILRNVGGLLGKRKQRNSRRWKVITWPAAPERAVLVTLPGGALLWAPSAASPQHPRSIPGATRLPGTPPCLGHVPLSPPASLRAPGLAVPAGPGSLACRGGSLGCSLLALAGSPRGDWQIREELSLPFPTTRALAAIACTKVRLCRHPWPCIHIIYFIACLFCKKSNENLVKNNIFVSAQPFNSLMLQIFFLKHYLIQPIHFINLACYPVFFAPPK